MKLKLACASLLVLSACGPSREAMSALQDMQILQNDPNAPLSYASISGSGNDVTLSGVEMRVGAGLVAMMTGPQTVRLDLNSGDFAVGDAAAPSLTTEEAAKPTTVAKAGSMTLRGLTLKDGKPIVRDIVLKGITPTVPMEGASVSLGSLSFEGMNETTGQFIAGAFTKNGMGAPPPLEQWSFTRAGIGAMSLAVPIPQEEGEGGSVNVQLGELSIANLKDKTIGLILLDGLKGDVAIPGMPPVAGTFDLGRLEVGGIRTERVASEFMTSFNERMNPGAPVDYAAMYKDYTSPLDGGIDRVAWNGVKADFSGLKLTMDGLNSSVQRNAEDVATGISFPRATLKVTADSSGGTLGAMGLMMLAMSGYDSNSIEMYLEGAAAFDPAKDLTRWDNYNLGVTDAFDVKMSVGVAGLQKALPTLLTAISQFQAAQAVEDDADDAGEGEEDADGGDEDEDAEDEGADFGGGIFGGANGAAMGSLIMGLLPLSLTDLDMSITDQKVVDLILEQQAIPAGQTVEQLRQDLVGMLTGGAVFMTDAGVDAAIANELSAAAAGFMSGPGTLHITLKPKQPLGVMSAMLMPITKESLGFSATFTPLVKAEPVSQAP
jgi:hypothetical protein